MSLLVAEGGGEGGEQWHGTGSAAVFGSGCIELYGEFHCGSFGSSVRLVALVCVQDHVATVFDVSKAAPGIDGSSGSYLSIN